MFEPPSIDDGAVNIAGPTQTILRLWNELRDDVGTVEHFEEQADQG